MDIKVQSIEYRYDTVRYNTKLHATKNDWGRAFVTLFTRNKTPYHLHTWDVMSFVSISDMTALFRDWLFPAGSWHWPDIIYGRVTVVNYGIMLNAAGARNIQLIFQSFWCWKRNNLPQYHNCWCHGFLHRQDISRNDIDYFENKPAPCLLQIKILDSCAVSMSMCDAKIQIYLISSGELIT